ncbi:MULTISPECIES: hypothetical protein [Staphylococcus]|mgnify:FL=1|uniref:hypothetical protein n=1 Tax=Staphylococcus TaxID=1279 RepID=UPI00069F61A7|nr:MULTISPECIES: hypothetical protein [Staphylococcus]MBY6179767.1 hypothetical protein [Staphylococcaceae bacterium DP2N0-1]MCH4388423.1 hypothetical protein [Staphylococcus haemolyticus]MCH4403196.1 hypothetical protein [Staphylococcus haemolyticus]MCH4518238.1 hypothetical protein [Staphylococcus haemolyticus]MCI2943103.1 hypothetical protein [Staphylococcus haemolyticus]
MKKLRQHSKFNSYLKVSCSVLLMSGTLVGYGFTKDGFAQSNDRIDNVSSEMTSVQNKLDKAIDKAKTKIDRLKYLQATDIKSYKEDIEDARNQSEIDQILRDAQEEDRISNEESARETGEKASTSNESSLSTAEQSSTNEEDKLDELDKIIADLDSLSEKVDTHQQSEDMKSEQGSTNNSENSQISSGQSVSSQDITNHMNEENDDTSILDEMDNVKNDIESTKESAHSSVEDIRDQTDSSIQDDNSTESHSKDNTNTASDKSILSGIKQIDKDEISHKSNKIDSKEGHIDALTDELSANQKIDQAITKVENKQNNTSKRYSDHKLEQLRQLEQQVKQNNSLTNEQKQNIEKDIRNVRQNVKANRDEISGRLEQSSNKQATVEQILGSVFSKNEAQKIAKQIKTNGQSDKQITDQMMKHIDNLKTTTSDDILASMFDQAPDKEALIKTLLSTRLGNNEASQIAKQLAKENLSSSELVNQVKQKINANQSVTADDILKDVLDKSSDPKQTIETLLATKLNQTQAKALADLIARAQTDKADALDLVKNALNGTGRDLLQLQNKLDTAKNNLNYILDPITNRPSLFDRINGSTSSSNLLNQGSHLLDGLTGGGLLDGLNSGGSLLDNIEDIPNPVQGLSLGQLGDDDGFLSGLFDDEGNLSLPNTGEVVKKSWLPVTVLLVIAGGTLIGLGRRKQQNTKH